MCMIGRHERVLKVSAREPLLAYKVFSRILGAPPNSLVPQHQRQHGFYSVPGGEFATEYKVRGSYQSHILPVRNNDAGFWAYKSRRDWVGESAATVRLWGKVIAHKNGYRAQFMCISGRKRDIPRTLRG